MGGIIHMILQFCTRGSTGGAFHRVLHLVLPRPDLGRCGAVLRDQPYSIFGTHIARAGRGEAFADLI